MCNLVLSVTNFFVMDLVIPQKGYLHESQTLSPMQNSPTTSLFSSNLHSSSHSNFPIIAVAIIGILATGFLLVSYYIFVIKCCLNWNRIGLLRRFSFSQQLHGESQLMIPPPALDLNRGLDEAVIQSIPVFQYKKGERRKVLRRERSLCDFECAVCLNEFQEEEKLRIIPNCAHVFHIDCIDVWLQSNANCPLCRTIISAESHFVPIFSPRNRNNNHMESYIGGDEDYVVIELGEENNLNQPKVSQKRKKNFNHVSSMGGDECISIRLKDEPFAIQPIRRSFSLDSSADPILHLAVQEIVQQRQRSFFTFRHERSSSTVLPIQSEP